MNSLDSKTLMYVALSKLIVDDLLNLAFIHTSPFTRLSVVNLSSTLSLRKMSLQSSQLQAFLSETVLQCVGIMAF
jgi:hypothetical protein